MSAGELCADVLLMVGFFVFGAVVGGTKARDTDDTKLERCISTCSDKVASYTKDLCVCQSGLKLEGE